jgi:hypothetical protein
MDRSPKDTAEGTFLEHWPMWLRWVFVLPSSLISSVVASTLYLLLNSLSGFFFGFYAGDGFFFQLMSSFILGGVFVYAGAWMAPRKQFIVSILLLILFSFITAILFLFSFPPYSSTGPVAFGIHGVAGLVAGAMVVVHLKEFT